ncbi:MAG: hypothetical protein CVU10_09945 [Bacteroidetes bacterium HGW-Bacteroidetes-5]|jgi:hypothetical protein|nr:MAG: hypothetical protein CVU10_09945 [Bacteroidetes bacterium HGW-Bacteroidetes-5]
MKDVYRLLILTAVLAVAGCKSELKTENGGVAVIDLASEVGKGKIVNLSEIASDIRYVKLETSDSSLIGEFPYVFYENERIYFFSKWVLKVFDKDGKFLFKFHKIGRGPQEYKMIRNIRIMSGTGEIMVQTKAMEGTGNLIFYDRNGNFLKKKSIPYNNNAYQNKFYEVNDNLFITAASPILKKSTYWSAIVYDSLLNVIKTIPTSSIPEYEMQKYDEITISKKRSAKSSITLFRIPYPELYRFKDNIRFLFSLNDTIFSIDSKLNYSPAFCINYGKYKNVSKNRDHITYLGGDHININPEFFIESEENIILQFNMRDFCLEPYDEILKSRKGQRVFKHSYCYALYNKKTGKFTFLNQPVKGVLGFKDDLKGGPVFLPTSISSDFQASALFTASQIIDFASTNDVKGEFREIVKGLKDTDNPIVAIVKMK